jgi:hypothetical protein
MGAEVADHGVRVPAFGVEVGVAPHAVPAAAAVVVTVPLPYSIDTERVWCVFRFPCFVSSARRHRPVPDSPAGQRAAAITAREA